MFIKRQRGSFGPLQHSQKGTIVASASSFALRRPTPAPSVVPAFLWSQREKTEKGRMPGSTSGSDSAPSASSSTASMGAYSSAFSGSSSATTSGKRKCPFGDDYLAKLTRLMFSQDADAAEKMDKIVDEAWATPDVAPDDLWMDPEDLDTHGGAKSNSQMATNMKRIAGTQRISAPVKKKVVEVVPAEPAKKKLVVKKQVPIIDDSQNHGSNKHCKVCNGSSSSANDVLACNGCSDAYHMKCHQPPISHEDASDVRFIFLCSECNNPGPTTSKSSSRSQSPKPKVGVDVPKKKDKEKEKKINTNKVPNISATFEVYKKKKERLNALQQQMKQ